ncbi:hypothetical protein ABK040_009896 [Willaertia magna]
MSLVPRGNRIYKLLSSTFQPSVLKIRNKSKVHEQDPLHKEIHEQAGGESYIDVYIVSDSFKGRQQVERQRMIMKILQSEFISGLHALTVNAKTLSEHETFQDRVERMKELRKHNNTSTE